jgi:hypothetical protein
MLNNKWRGNIGRNFMLLESRSRKWNGKKRKNKETHIEWSKIERNR